MKRHPLPNFMPLVSLDRDGGLDRLDEVWDLRSRYIPCAIKLSYAVLNIVLQLSLNWTVLCALWHHLSAQGGTVENEVHHFDNIRDRDRRICFIWVASTVACLETVATLFLFVWGWILLLKFTCSESEFVAFINLELFFRDYIPLVQCFSSIKMGYYVHPAKIRQDHQEWHHEVSCCGVKLAHDNHGRVGHVLVTIAFVISRVFCAAVAVMGFGVKVVIVAEHMMHTQYNFWLSWAQLIVLLLNSCIGIVILEEELQDRVFLFIFAGTDADYQEGERCIRDVYRARLAHKIWEDYWQVG
eukprot:CAMPEP_0115268972 /NCGR_PEP_ID=MMETSP0270-20121206/52793_1 /TAXON_ID=71861 /ORGANISM="Scrippsiella trochoidea, Strain CCMP3099" /LENGTH=298 /DNA_ID=CAMNT_0002685185 /DNA_START=15 /DNA_END=908 /DNA_ORIENTATION=-